MRDDESWGIGLAEIVLLCALVVLGARVLVPGSSEAATVSGMMFGTETEEGNKNKPVRMIVGAECSERDNSLLCHFNSVSIDKAAGGVCRLLAAAWTETFRRVPVVEATEARWAATRGPEGLSGVLVTTTLTVKFLDKARAVGLLSELIERRSYTNPSVQGVTLKPGVMHLKGGLPDEPAECVPNSFFVMPDGGMPATVKP